MSVTIKSAREIELMREAGRILAKVHEELGKAIHPGMSTLDIDRLGEKLIREFGCVPSFKNYNGYPASICVSVNDEVVSRTSTILSGKAISSAWMRVLSTKDIILMQPEPMRLASSVRKRRSLSMLPDNLSLRGLSSRKLAIISMISLPQSRPMQKASDTVLSAIWWDTVSDLICTRSRRCRTLRRSARASSWFRV